MKAIVLMFDSLNRHYLPCYGGPDWVNAPNFSRLAERTVVCDQAYAGSMPCMPTRREIHTGRHNFMHRAWGPLEPFDDSMPELLKQQGVYTHLISDHHHYWEDGGATYHTRYNSWEFPRGQEYDRWKGEVADPELPERIGKTNPAEADWIKQHYVNRKYIRKEEDHPLAQTFALGEEFIRKNAGEDNWFLQLENFSPHEPFMATENFRTLYGLNDDGPDVSWPRYGAVQPEDLPDKVRREYAAALTMCDDYLGQFLDTMDELNLWDDTLLIVTTDHGFLLGEKGWLAKCVMPFYNEVANIPYFVWDPRTGRKGGRSDKLVQMIDVAPTLLEYFNQPRPADMLGQDLHALLEGRAEREACLCGMHGGHVNCIDGRYVYMRAPETDDGLYNYTLMATHIRSRFSTEELRLSELAPPLSFTKGCPVLKIPAEPFAPVLDNRTLLFDLQEDPQQLRPLEDEGIEQMMVGKLRRLMKENNAPSELYARFGLAAE